jgi:predicted nucleic acid-binding protein
LKTYYDTGILLKLYMGEASSEAVQHFVHSRGESLAVTDLHLSECVSAMKLRAFRRECRDEEASEGIGLIMEDLKSGVLRLIEVDWPRTWHECRLTSEKFASSTGVRTLDALHVATARLCGAQELVTTYARQSRLAARVGLRVIDPTRRRGKRNV